MKKEIEIKCDKCSGEGWYQEPDIDEYTGKLDMSRPVQVECEKCKGTGNLTKKNNS